MAVLTPAVSAPSPVTVATGVTPKRSNSSVVGSQAQINLDQLLQIAQSNSAASAQQAAELRDWQEIQNKKLMTFNAKEAAKNRDWQKMMSDTAHQREIADLRAAGLNPILSAMNGNGAAVTSGATASGATSSGAKGDVDMSVNSAIVSLMASMLSAQTNLEAMRMSAASNQAIADKNNASAQLIAEINGLFGNEREHISGSYSMANLKSSQAFQEYMAKNYPNNTVQAVNALLSSLFGANGVSGVVASAKDKAKASVDNSLLGDVLEFFGYEKSFTSGKYSGRGSGFTR